MDIIKEYRENLNTEQNIACDTYNKFYKSRKNKANTINETIMANGKNGNMIIKII